MRRALLACALAVALAGCAASGSQSVAAPNATHASPTEGARTVPSGAFVTAADLGSAWTTTAPSTTPCAPAYARSAVRSSGFAEPRGSLTETLALVEDVSAAVASWRHALQRCGYAVSDDALGDASVAARSKDGTDAVVATGTDGVLVVLYAHGMLARAHDEMEGWADLALGTSCVAAKDGCH